MYEFNIFSTGNASPNFSCTNMARESCKTEDSDSVGLGCISNTLCDDIACNRRTHYTCESIAPNLAVVKFLPSQSTSLLRLSHL